jgi:tRNA1Val (adenine37-N6)-methyltransferase
MANSYFQFKQFTIHQDKCAMKVTTDSCLFGAYVNQRVRSQESGVGKALDIGAGTGLLTLMVAQETEVVIDAIEIDKDAFEQAEKNVAASPWADRIKVMHADAEKSEFPTRYDVIISNPPFYDNELKSNDVKKNIAHHNEGLLLPRLLQVIKKTLQPDGSFYLLLPFKRNDEIKKLFIENKLSIRQLVLVRQSVNHDYFRIMLAGKLKAAEQDETMIEEISIKIDAEQYTPDFINLLKEFYLHL